MKRQQNLPTHILVAEDSPVCRKLLKDIFADQRYEVHVAHNGQEALTGFQMLSPDIMILDWMMPDISGAELCRMVRRTQKAYTYIILITSNTQRERVIEGLDAGADDYLTKPFDSGELLARVRVGCRVIAMSREIERRNAELEQAAHTDHLTGLPNRKAVEEFGSRQFHAAMRQGFPLWVVIADLDKFKLLNDGYGHAVGDEAIKAFASILKGNTRSADLCGRIGGDEFMLVISYGELKPVTKFIDRLRSKLANERFCLNGKKVHMTASFGIAGIQGKGDTFQSLLIQADHALYGAKASGRNRVVVAPPNGGSKNQRHEGGRSPAG